MATRQIRKKRSAVKVNYNYPVILVCKSNKNMQLQLMEEVTKKTLFTISTRGLKGTKTEKSMQIGELAGKKLKASNVDKVVFNRNGFLYHGRVKAVAESIRAQGIII